MKTSTNHSKLKEVVKYFVEIQILVASIGNMRRIRKHIFFSSFLKDLEIKFESVSHIL